MTTRTRKEAGLVYRGVGSETKGNSRAEREGMDTGFSAISFSIARAGHTFAITFGRVK
jgi:hypothetical protein